MIEARLAASPLSTVRRSSRADSRSEPTARTVHTLEQAARATLTRCIEDQECLLGAVLASVDGLPIADFVPPPRSASKLGAMTSALLALCDAAARESEVGTSQQIMLEGDQGRLIAMAVDFRDRACVLLVVACASKSLGQVLWAARQCRDEIAAIQ